MEPIEVEGKTIDEAVENAVTLLKTPKERLLIETISNGSQGFLGVIGSKKARIRASILKDPVEEKMEKATLHLERLLSLANLSSSVTASFAENKIFLTIRGDGTGLLIGKRGQTLDALQYLVNKIVNRDPEGRIPIIVDTENYRNRREEKLVSIAHRLGERAKRQRMPVTTGPLSSQERRVIYVALQDNPDLTAKSEGDGELKRVIIAPRKRS